MLGSYGTLKITSTGKIVASVINPIMHTTIHFTSFDKHCRLNNKTGVLENTLVCEKERIIKGGSAKKRRRRKIKGKRKKGQISAK